MPSRMPNLKLGRCPFCGNDDDDYLDTRLVEIRGVTVFVVECEWCDARGPTATLENEAIAEWNARGRRVADGRKTQRARQG